MTETPEERVEDLSYVECKATLMRIVEIVDAHRGGGTAWLTLESAPQAADLIADTLRDWSLIE